ncbi:hypothetical protein [Deinococcus hopiensis]|uniref:hypothetical protein n=1 Tax=Deinococcus hopiensis TaxID=309885 RepID=UPI000A0293E1|nr:hypothetical protein [Deinococcus hopiensis]
MDQSLEVEDAGGKAQSKCGEGAILLVEDVPAPLQGSRLSTFGGDPHIRVRRQVAQPLSAAQLHSLLGDLDPDVRVMALRRLLDGTRAHEVPTFLLRALLAPRSSAAEVWRLTLPTCMWMSSTCRPLRG